MGSSSDTFLDLLAQLTGGRADGHYVIVNYALAALFWGVLFAVARGKRRDNPQPHEQWLTGSFAIALGRELFMIAILALQALKLVEPAVLMAIFPPIEHTLRDIYETLLASAFLLYLLKNTVRARVFLYGTLVTILVCYGMTFAWWAQYVGANPTAQFDDTWCDWLFRSVISLWLACAIWMMSRAQATPTRNLVCAGFAFILLYQVAKLPDMALEGALSASITPLRRLCNLLGIALLTFAYLRDIAGAQREAHIKILELNKNLTQRDHLTGLPNLVFLRDQFANLINQRKTHSGNTAILFLDIDLFKTVNDSLGHGIGDKLLKCVSSRLESLVGPTDLLCRQGGDEFIILMPEIEDSRVAGRLAEKVLIASAMPYYVDRHELCVNLSIGISVDAGERASLDTLVSNAEMAMYQAKLAGRNGYEFFKQDLSNRANERLALQTSLHHALEDRQFSLRFQPKFDLRSGQITGNEALIRWEHPTRGMISPMNFIPIAEQTGLIVPIGDWVLREACRQNRAWQSSGLTAMPVSVNVSAVQLAKTDFLKTVTNALQTSGLSANYLELELTETALMQDIALTVSVLNALKKIGVRLSIDDFGAGYSSLNYLRTLPVDTLKIDQSFLRQVMSNSADAGIVRATITMARGLNLKVVAEGVETEDQLRFLRKHDCDEMQGYLFSKPLTAQEVENFLRQNEDTAQHAQSIAANA